VLSFLNPAVRRDAEYRGLFEDHEYQLVEAFYDARRDLLPTPLLPLPGLAKRLSIGSLLVKDETARFGLEAFKIAGARYAVESLDPASLTSGVVCATAGNHGRAVARAARDLRVRCTVFVPAAPLHAADLDRQTRSSRIAGMRADGAGTIDVAGSYEDAVAQATDYARRTGATMVSDTSMDPGDRIARLIMAGYTRLFAEAARQWDAVPDVVLIQGGVGGLVCAAANWCAARVGARRPFLIACEPDSAACLLESARAGRVVPLDRETPMATPTMMAGLRCAVPSAAAWPSVHRGVDAFVSIPDAIVLTAMDALRCPEGSDPALATGPSGACGAGALLALAAAPEMAALRAACGLSRSTRAMVVATEGP
jgi:diaminopropionate ammonia-lyase